MPLFGKRTAVRADVDKIVAHHGTRWRELAKGLGKDVPDLPVAVAVCDDVARPGYTSIDATELRDAPDVEAVKVNEVLRLDCILRSSIRPAARSSVFSAGAPA